MIAAAVQHCVIDVCQVSQRGHGPAALSSILPTKTWRVVAGVQTAAPAISPRAFRRPMQGDRNRQQGSHAGAPPLSAASRARPKATPNVLLSAQKQGADLDYVLHISRGSDNVATHTVQADSDAQAFDLAIEWAASLLLAADDDVVLAIQLPSGAFKTYARKDF